MIHRKVEKPELIQQGSRIAYMNGNQLRVNVVKRHESGVIVVERGPWNEQFVRPQDYLYTIQISPDLEEHLGDIRQEISDLLSNHESLQARALILASQVWTRCEQHYGITVDGSKPDDPRRRVAFLILKGDRPALDVATDILGG